MMGVVILLNYKRIFSCANWRGSEPSENFILPCMSICGVCMSVYIGVYVLYVHNMGGSAWKILRTQLKKRKS